MVPTLEDIEHELARQDAEAAVLKEQMLAHGNAELSVAEDWLEELDAVALVSAPGTVPAGFVRA